MDEPFIELHYGPYECHGVIRHKIQRLHGISEQLTKLGYSVEYIPSNHLNRLTVVMKQCEIFRCDIRNLLFNMYYIDDIIGKRLVAAVEEARKRMYNDNNIPMYNSVSAGMRLVQKQREAEGLQEILSSVATVLFEIPLSGTGKKIIRKSETVNKEESEPVVIAGLENVEGGEGDEESEEVKN